MHFRIVRSLLITTLVFSFAIVAEPPPATSRSVPVGGMTLDESLPAPLARDGIDVVSTQSNSVVKFVPIGALVSGVTIRDFGNRVYVSLPDRNRVVMLNASTDTAIGSFLVGHCPKRGGLEKCNITGLDTTGAIGYAAGDTRFDHGDMVQFTSQSNRFIDIGSASALVLAP